MVLTVLPGRVAATREMSDTSSGPTRDLLRQMPVGARNHVFGQSLQVH